jgi:glycosyltransferase involved in cell wall biosynthesis
MQKDICIAIDAVGIRDSGAAAVLCELLDWLPQIEPTWFWHVFLLDDHLRYFELPVLHENVTIEKTTRGNKWLDRLYWLDVILPRKLKQLKPQCLFCMANIGLSKPPVPQIIFVHQLKAIESEHFFDNLSLMQRLRLWYMRHSIVRSASSSQAVIVQTKHMRDRLTAIAPKLNKRTIVIPSGYRTAPAHISVSSKVKTLLQQAIGQRLVYISLPSAHKNHLNLIQAFSQLLQNHKNIYLLMTIDPKNTDDPQIKNITNLAYKLGCYKNIIWLGKISSDEVMYVLSNSDIMVFPSLSESFGLPLAEAMAVGCPIAVADLPYAREVAGSAAWYFDPLNPSSIVQKVNSLLNDAEAQKILSEEGRINAKRYNYEVITQQITLLLNNCINK